MSLVYDKPWLFWWRFHPSMAYNRFLLAKPHRYRRRPECDKIISKSDVTELTLIKPIISHAPAAGKACKKHPSRTLWKRKNREQNDCGSVSRNLYPIRSRFQRPVINFQNRAFTEDFLFREVLIDNFYYLVNICQNHWKILTAWKKSQ